MKAPNFLIIGAQRSGTTTLAHCLSLHPQVYLHMSDSEPKFFSREQEYVKGIEHYLKKYFSLADGFQAIGEKSTEYMENLSVAKRIYRFSPNMKLICELRHPVERAVSNYWYSLVNGLESRHINDALRLEWKKYLKNPPKITQIFSTQPHAYIYRSLYYDNLKSFYELFPKRNIRCIMFEEFMKDMKKAIEDLCLFLGVEPIGLPLERIKPQRVVEEKEPLDLKLYNELENFFYEKNKNLSDLIGKDMWQFWNDKTLMGNLMIK